MTGSSEPSGSSGSGDLLEPARLSLATLPRLAGRTDVLVPTADPAGIKVAIVHLGLGAFHRAHQAVFTEDALARAGIGDDWGICGFTQRSRTVRDQLAPQDGLYTVLERGAGAAPPRVVGILREVRSAIDDEIGPAVRIADPAVRLVTLTVTEKGYRAGPDGHLDLNDAGIRADLEMITPAPTTPSAERHRRRPVTVIGQLVAGLQERQGRSGADLTLLSCDNLAGNGATLRRLVLDFCAAMPGGDDLGGWIEQACRFPSSMVDRIVPATRDTDRAQAAGLLGLIDQGVVVAEPFRQWVIQDTVGADRPPWELAGAIITDDVAGYEAVKLRTLNAAHSLLAYAGALAGHVTIAEAVADPVLALAAHSLMVQDAGPTLRLPDGLDLAGYQASVLERFANPVLGHRTEQVAADGSLKLPIRLLGTARDRLAAGAEPYWVAYAVAAWMVFVTRRRAADGRPLTVDDPLLDRLATAVEGRTDAASIVEALLGVREIFAEDLATDPSFRSLLVHHAEQFLTSAVTLR